MSKKPAEHIDSRDQQTVAPKKPGSANNAIPNGKREARLAKALRANLRRRKSGAPEKGERES